MGVLDLATHCPRFLTNSSPLHSGKQEQSAGASTGRASQRRWEDANPYQLATNGSWLEMIVYVHESGEQRRELRQGMAERLSL